MLKPKPPDHFSKSVSSDLGVMQPGGKPIAISEYFLKLEKSGTLRPANRLSPA